MIHLINNKIFKWAIWYVIRLIRLLQYLSTNEKFQTAFYNISYAE